VKEATQEQIRDLFGWKTIIAEKIDSKGGGYIMLDGVPMTETGKELPCEGKVIVMKNAKAILGR